MSTRIRQSFVASFGFVIGCMLLAGLSQHLFITQIQPRAMHEAFWFKGLLGAWGLVLLVGIKIYFRQLYQVLSSVRTSVAILTLFTLSCVAGSFVLQKRDLDSRGLKGEKAYAAFRLAEAGFLHYMWHGQNYRQPMSDNGKAFFSTVRERFGDKFADERTELFHKMMGGRSKDSEIKEFADAYDDWFRSLWDFCRITRLYDIHRSWAFITLMTLLSICLCAGTYKRFVLRLDQLGFYSTHLGFVVLMVGFTLSMIYEQRGILPLEVGKTLHQVWEFNSDKPLDLGFRLSLQKFYTEHHHELFTEFTDVDYQAKSFPGPIQRNLKPYAGSTYELWDGKYKIEVLDQSEYGSAAPDVIDRSDGPPQPAVQIDVDNPAGEGAQGWLFAGAGAQAVYTDPAGRFVLAYMTDEAQALRPPKSGDWGEIVLGAEGQEPKTVEVQEGSEFEYDGKHWKITQIAADFARRDAPLATQDARNPAVKLMVNAPGEDPLERWNFAWLDFDSMHTPAHAEVAIRFKYRAGNLEPTKVAHLLSGKSGLELIQFDAYGSPRRSPVELGKRLPLGIEDFDFEVERTFARAARVFVVTPDYERERLKQDLAAPPEGWAGSTTAHDQAQMAGTTPQSSPASAEDHSGHNHGPGEHNHGVSPDLEAADRLLGPISPDVARRFKPPGPPAVKLKITHPGGSFERWFLSGHPEAGTWRDENMTLRFSPNTNKVKEWRSLLVATDGQTVRRQVVRVNTTMEFNGWTMYQTDADPKRPNYSGIQVLKDPGWYLIEPGLMMVCCGVIFMFWIKPWLRMDQSGGSRARKKVKK